MSREGEFVKNTAVLSVGKLLPKCTGFITLPILSAYLTKAEYGTYDLITTLVAFVIPIATLQIQSAAFRFLIDYRGNKEESSAIITDILAFTVPISVIASIIMQMFFPSASIAVRILIAVYFFMDTINGTFGQIARGLGHNKKYSIGTMVLSIVDMVCVVVWVYLIREGLTGVMIALAASQFGGALYLACSLKLWTYYSPGRVSFARIKELLAYSWPMVPNNLSSWVLKLSDRLVITAFLGVEANAVYAIANKIPNILMVVHSIVMMAWQENASIAVTDSDAEEYFSKMYITVLKVAFGFTALLIAATPILFALFVRGNYDDAYYQMPVLIFAQYFNILSAFVGGIYIAHKKTVNVGLSTAFAAGINLAIDLIFVNLIGIWAGSISTLVAYIVLYIYRLINSRKFQPLKVHAAKQLLMMAVIAGMLTLCFLRIRVLDVVNLILGVGIFLFFNRDLIQKTMKKIRKR